MIRSNHGISIYFLCLAVACCFAVPGASVAQTATDLKCKGCVGKKDVGKNAVTSKAIKKRQVKPSDLAKSAKPTAVAVSEKVDGSGPTVGNALTVVRTATIKAPGPGAVVAFFSLVANGAASDSLMICGATTGTTIDDQVLSGTDVGLDDVRMVSGARTFPVSAKGNVTVRLICYAFTPPARAAYPSLTLLFVPNAQSIVSETDTAAEKSGIAFSLRE